MANVKKTTAESDSSGKRVQCKYTLPQPLQALSHCRRWTITIGFQSMG